MSSWQGIIAAQKAHIVEKLSTLTDYVKQIDDFPNSVPDGVPNVTVIYSGSSRVPQMTNSTNERVFIYRATVGVPIEAETFSSEIAETLAIALSEEVLHILDTQLVYGSAIADRWDVAQEETAITTENGVSLFLTFTITALKEATVKLA